MCHLHLIVYIRCTWKLCTFRWNVSFSSSSSPFNYCCVSFFSITHSGYMLSLFSLCTHRWHIRRTMLATGDSFLLIANFNDRQHKQNYICAESQFGGFNNMLPDLYSTNLVNSSVAFIQCKTCIQKNSDHSIELISSLHCIASWCDACVNILL